MPGDHIFKKSSLLREWLVCCGALLISVSLLAGSSMASGHGGVEPQDASDPIPGSLVTETYEFTGEPEAFTVPAGVQEIGVKALGAAGGYGGISVEPVRDTVLKPSVARSAAASASTPEGSFAPGGGGGEVEASIPVGAGQTLTVNVGGVGTTAESPERRGFPTVRLPARVSPLLLVAPGAPGKPGGYNGGGEGGGSEYFYGEGSTFLFFGGGGGGASTLSLSSVPLIVAGGGGGGGANRGGRSTRGQAGVVLGGTLRPRASGGPGKQVVLAPPSETTLPSSGGNGGGSIAQEGEGESGAAGSAAGGAGGGESTSGSARETGGGGQGDNSTDDPDDEGGFTGGGGGGGYYGGLGGSFGICIEACEEAGGGGGGGGSNYATPSASGAFFKRGARTEGGAGLVTLSYFDPYPTTTEATPAPSRASAGETVTLTGTVDAEGPCEGTIEFLLDGVPVGAPIPVSSNSAQTTITAPPPGSHKIVAIYSGVPSTSSAPGCLPSQSDPSTLTTTEPFPTTTTATPTPSRASTGETVTLTGTVKAAGPCEGTIEFLLDGIPIGTPIPVSSNSAQTTITAPPAGSHKIIAIYSGAPTTSTSPGCLPSRSEPSTLTTTEPFPTTTTATPTPSRASTGETVTLTGTVKAAGPCEGTIEFLLDGIPIGTPIPVSSNSAQTTITAPPAGSHKIIAIYSGAPATSSSPGCLPSRSEPSTLTTTEPFPTTTTATPTPSRASTGETVTLTGTVKAAGPCEGTIEFLLDGIPIGTPIPVSSNSAQTTITAPPAGSHKIIAIYSGAPATSSSPGCLPSRSEPSTLTTTEPFPTTTTATPTPSRASTGETVTLTGTVKAAGPCEGTIEFLLDGIPIGTPIPVSSNSAQTTITAPPAGSHKIIAIYSGAPATSSSPGCLPSRSEPSTLTTTEPFPTTTTATPTPSRASTGETVTLTGTVKAAGPCEGTIEFLLDGIPIGTPIPVSSNSAQTTITAPPAGSHKIIAIYSGAPATSSSPGCLPSRSEPSTLTTVAAPLTNAEALVPVKRLLPCQSARRFAIHLQLPRRLKLLGAVVYIDGKFVKHLGEKTRVYRLNLQGRPYATITITLSAREPDGHTVTGKRIYHTCRAHKLPAHTKFKI